MQNARGGKFSKESQKTLDILQPLSWDNVLPSRTFRLFERFLKKRLFSCQPSLFRVSALPRFRCSIFSLRNLPMRTLLAACLFSLCFFTVPALSQAVSSSDADWSILAELPRQQRSSAKDAAQKQASLADAWGQKLEQARAFQVNSACPWKIRVAKALREQGVARGMDF